ncbi:MAG: BON domain-containing protein [Pseudomonadota bacterium]
MRPTIAITVTAAVALLAACVQQPEPARPDLSAPPPVRSRIDANRDDALKAVIERRLHEIDRHAMRAVTVEVWQGRALLMGAVAKPEQRRKAEAAARAVSGVAEVVNELVLAEDRALDLFAPDPAREGAVRTALGLEGKAGITVRVVNGVAFLLGAAASRDQAEAMKADALDVEGIKWAVAVLTAP